MISRSTLSGAMRVAIASATARIAMDKTTAKIEMIPKIQMISMKMKEVKKSKNIY